MSDHSKFSPSGSTTWLACPASIRLSEGIEDVAGDAAVRGTEIHAQAEALLLGLPEPFPEHSEYAASYVEFVRGLVEEGDTLLIEERLYFDEYAPGGFGTADVVILPERNGYAKVADLKTGRGEVPATTPQLMIYALALIQRYLFELDLAGVVVYVWQNGRVDSYVWTTEELLAAGTLVRQAAEAALDPTTKPVPGEKQCQWCKARSRCTARAIYVLEQAGEAFGVTTLAEILPVARRVGSWSEEVQARAQKALEDGATIRGFKLVEGVSRRKWLEGAPDALAAAGVPEEAIYEVSPRSITDFEKVMGKKAAAPFLALATEKPPGKPTLVPADDPRPNLNPEF